jgi:RNA polymerase sigma-70 factor (ECF subfamily)
MTVRSALASLQRGGDPAPRGDVHASVRVSLITMDDADVVAQALAGDTAAFAILVDRHASICLRYATRMLGSREDAEDVMQEALMRAFRALTSYDTRRDFRTWLLSIVANRCRTALVARHRRERFLTIDAAASESVALASDGADEDDLRAVQWALAQLEPMYREAFLLKHVEGLNYEEIAQVTGVRVSALKMRVRRACERMRDLLEDENARTNA